jgi:hypothetical protein
LVPFLLWLIFFYLLPEIQDASVDALNSFCRLGMELGFPSPLVDLVDAINVEAHLVVGYYVHGVSSFLVGGYSS